MRVALARASDHRTFLVVALAAFALRYVLMLGYHGFLWFPDSRAYLGVALRLQPYPVRPQGYAFFLRLLLPLHSFTAVTALQHLMGLAVGGMVYALLRHRFGLPGWGASLAAVPVLFDGLQLQVEHMLMSDALFELLVVGAVTVVLWRPRPAVWQAAAAGALLGLAAVTRSVGLPLVGLLLVFLLLRGAGWRRLVAAGVLSLAPVLGYATWFHSTWGRFALSNSSGLTLFARTTDFVDCERLRLPPEERLLCPSQPPGRRPASPNYLWRHRLTPALPVGPYEKFTPAQEARAEDFAKRAIAAQPFDYLTTALRDFTQTFAWPHGPYPNRFDASRYRFPTSVSPPGDSVMVRGGTFAQDVHEYSRSPNRVQEPYAEWLRIYQRHVFLPGTLLGVILAVGALGLIQRWRQLGGAALLPWLTAFALIAIPPLTVSFSPRYIVPAVPLACIAAGAALSRRKPRGNTAVTQSRRGGAPPRGGTVRLAALSHSGPWRSTVSADAAETVGRPRRRPALHRGKADGL